MLDAGLLAQLANADRLEVQLNVWRFVDPPKVAMLWCRNSRRQNTRNVDASFEDMNKCCLRVIGDRWFAFQRNDLDLQFEFTRIGSQEGEVVQRNDAPDFGWA